MNGVAGCAIKDRGSIFLQSDAKKSPPLAGAASLTACLPVAVRPCRRKPQKKRRASIVQAILPRGPLFSGKKRESVPPLSPCPQVQGAIHYSTCLWKYQPGHYKSMPKSSSATSSSRSACVSFIRSETGSTSSSLSMYFSCKLLNFTLLFVMALCSSSMCFLRSR